MFRVALTNAQTNTMISKLLLSVGFTAEAIDEGNSLYNLARKAFDDAKLARLKRSEAYKSFLNKMTDFENQFLVDLKKAKAVFSKNILAQEKLGLESYDSLIDDVKQWI